MLEKFRANVLKRKLKSIHFAIELSLRKISYVLYVHVLMRPRCILVPRAHDLSGQWQRSRALVWSNTGSPRFTELFSNLANPLG